MIRLLMAGLLLVSVNAVADTQVTHTLKDGDVIKAEEFNKNFDDLEAAIDNIPAGATGPAGPKGDTGPAGAIGPQGPAGIAAGLTCSNNQIIKWNGFAWACAADPLANLSCSEGDILTYTGSVFSCASIAACISPGTPITNSNFDAAITDWIASGNASEYGDITKWCTGAVTDMKEAFWDKTTFNEDISAWDTSKVDTMAEMFRGATAFNENIGDWDTSKVTEMDFMFQGATAFNQDIGSWDTSNVIIMYGMFEGATAFNQDLNWDTSNVTYMGAMFDSATAFDQDISGWNVGAVTECEGFATNAGALTPPVFTLCSP